MVAADAAVERNRQLGVGPRTGMRECTTRVPATDDRFDVPLRGVAVDGETRCAHYASPVDVVAMRFGCCETYFPCFRCHEATTDHEARPWPGDRFDEPAVLCGACRSELSVTEYRSADEECPACGAAFNPDCRGHYDRYFEQPGDCDR